MEYIEAEVGDVFKELQKGTSPLVILGRAGTGKTTLIKRYVSETEKNVVVVAPTGKAALNVGGRTIHSFFKFPIGVTVDKVIEESFLKRPPAIIENLDEIIIDEVSMVRADLLDCIDTYLKIHRNAKNEPFGGVRIIFIGDLLQLPPVVVEDEREVFEKAYGGKFFFASNSFKKIEESVKVFELKTIYRQSDKDFIELLERIRKNMVTIDDLRKLNSRVVSKSDLPEEIIILTTTKKLAEEINKQNMESLKGPEIVLRAYIEGDFPESYFPTDEVLHLKKGAQLLMVNNDPDKRWVNGSIGILEGFRRNPTPVLYVKLVDGEEVEVQRHKWEIYKYVWDEKEKKIKSVPVGIFEQFPVKPAWAITIHKAQGMTLDRVAIDLGTGAFAPGQLYVALSRARSMEGVYLLSPVYKSDVILDWEAFSWLS